ncbi:MAG: aspartoacylase [Elainellaceae cyanobacterium]
MTSHSISPIQQVLIVGATHGNEFTGAYVIKKLEQYPNRIRRSTFETLTLLANPQAFAQSRRYVDTDLNRCFRQQDLQDLTRSAYEEIRAREINALFGKRGKTPVDVILDLHTTTASMSLTVIIDSHPFNLRLAAYLQQINSSVKVFVLPKLEDGYSGLPSICGLGCTIEVGAVAPGVLQAEPFQQTEALIDHALDYLEYHNRGEVPLLGRVLTAYQQVGTIDYPRNTADEIEAMIHPQLQFKDYEPLHPGDLMFLLLSGEEIAYTGHETVYPVFINEAAYYEKGIAMVLTQKQQFELVTT